MTALEELAAAIGDASPAWQATVRADAQLLRAQRVGSPVEAIREGYLLHYGASRFEFDADVSTLLIGDWCYAAGLVGVADTGDLDAVRTLAALIAHAATATSESDRNAAWDNALSRLSGSANQLT